MEAQPQIQLFKNFIENNCLTKLTDNLRKDKKFLVMNFNELSKFNLELAELVLEQPKETIKAIEIAIEQLDLENSENIQIQFIKLPQDQEIHINRLRSKHIGKLIFTKGVVLTRTKVYPQITSAKFECPNCEKEINVLQLDINFKEPSMCSCGRKGKFRIKSKELKDTILIKLDELPERLIGSEQPNNVRVILQGELCKDDYAIHLGARIEVVGYVEEISLRTNQIKSVSCDFLFTVLNYRNLEFVDFDTKISKEEHALFDEIKSQKNPAKFISKLIFKEIYGYRKAKECVIYQQFGGTRYADRRDFSHVLLYGDVATSKSDIALIGSKINPISKISTGTNISNVGLTVSAKKDELTGNWMAVAGLLPMCNNGVALIDEIEKMRDDDKKGLHTPMEHGFAPINKAGISAKLVANTSILATANPKVVGEPLEVVGNLDLPTPIIDRFDLIFTFKDIPETTKDIKIAEKLTNRATSEQNITTSEQNLTTFEHNDTTFTILTLRKYVYMCKKIAPKLSRRVTLSIHSWYAELRKVSLGFGYESKKPTPRTVESILRLARAITRAKMKDTITQRELQLAMSYFDFVYDKDSNPQVIEEDVVSNGEKEEKESKKEEPIENIPPTPNSEGEDTIIPTQPSETFILNAVRDKGDGGYPIDEFIDKYSNSRLMKLLEEGELVMYKPDRIKVLE